jgi:type ISP restriction-modification system protein
MGLAVSAEDFLAYVAGLVAHRGYSEKFAQHLTEPGVRIPLTAEANLWREGVEVGREILWLHTFGERCSDDGVGRPHGALALAELSGIRTHTPIVARQPGMPSSITPRKIEGSDDKINIIIGDGTVGPVKKEVWEYEVNGMHVIKYWFDSRRDSPMHKKNKKGLNAVSYGSWTPELTNELLAMLAVLNGCVQLEARQARLLNHVCEANLITDSELLQAQILPVPDFATKGPSPRKFATQALPGM